MIQFNLIGSWSSRHYRLPAVCCWSNCDGAAGSVGLAACQRATGISAPVNRTGPDGCPVVEPPLGSKLTASAALASASAVSCGRERAVVVPGRSLGKIPRERRLPSWGHQPDLKHVGGEIAGRREVEPQHQTPVGNVEIRRHHRPLILVEQHRYVRGPGGHRIDPAREAGQAVAESGDLARHAPQAPGCVLDACEPFVERRDLLGDRHAGGGKRRRQTRAAAVAAAKAVGGAPKAEAVPQPIEPALRVPAQAVGAICRAISSQTCARGSTAGADSARRLSLSSQSSTRSRKSRSPDSSRSKRRRARPLSAPSAYSAASRSRSSGSA